MKYLEYEKVKRDFQRLTAVSDEEFEAQQYGTLLENAEIYVVSQLMISPSELTEEQKAVCVYAAAKSFCSAHTVCAGRRLKS